MEGKGLLFKIYAGIDVFDIEVNEKDPDKFSNPALEMMAVPCWSSCITGMSNSSFRRRSISKHSGALMLSLIHI